MARQVVDDDRILRSINYRLKNTPISQLPRILGPLTSQLVTAGCDLTGTSSEVTWFKTRITSLLQDRSPSARLCAVVLVKTVLDLVGPHGVVQDKDRVAVWTRGLLDVLKRSGTTTTLTTRKCAIVALAKVFVLTWENATLVRELTTPTLPSFITACMQHFPDTTSQIKTPEQNELIGFVLEAFAQLLPRHHTVFRSFAAQIRTLSIAALCNDPFDAEASVMVAQETKDAASQLLVLLHRCAQKSGGAAEWEKGLDGLIVSCHATLDQVFRGVTEDWQSVAGVRSTLLSSSELPSEPYAEADDTTGGFPAWNGLPSGVERIHSLLSLLQAYIYTPTSTSVKLPLGRIVDLLTRLLYVHAPHSKDSTSSTSRFNPQISREERTELLTSLPALHVSTLEAVGMLFKRLEHGSLPVCAHFLDLLTWLFKAESFDAGVRTAVYACVAQILELTGPTLDKSSVRSVEKILRACCADLLPPKTDKPQTSDVISAQLTQNGTKAGTSASASYIAQQQAPNLATTLPGLHLAATALLPVAYTKLPVRLLSTATRTEMDRAAILTKHTDALVASVLNPAPGKASLLPFLTQMAPQSGVAEAILRPRVPVIVTGRREDREEARVDENGEEEIEDEEDDEMEKVAEAEADEDEEADDARRPKTVDWAELSKTQAPEQQERFEFGDVAGLNVEQSLSQSEVLPSSSKRGIVSEEATSMSVKRARVQQEGADADEGVSEEPVVSASETVLHADVGPAQAAVAAEESDDEDGSDFEMPSLYLNADDDDDGVEEHEEEE